MLDVKIKTFLMVSETLNYTEASKKLSLTQPAVSTHIKNLESEFNIKIFNRSNKKITLTKEGEILLTYAKRMQSLSLGIREKLKNQKNNIKTLIVGITPTAEENFVTQVFAMYCNKNPNIKIKIVIDTIKNIYSKIKTYELDFGIIEGKIIDKKIKSVILDTDYLCLAISNDNPLSKKSSVSLNELKKEKLILRPSYSGTRKLFESHLLSNQESIDNFNVIIEIDNVATIKDLVAANLGVTVIAKSACLEAINKGKFKTISIENLNMVREINIIYQDNLEEDSIINDIIQIYNHTK